ncbi:MAG: hypothetical protein J0I32_20790 [Sphingobacteriales bacterium]|nr:hypothetical protein [Sphingobacteriales bacterium]
MKSVKHSKPDNIHKQDIDKTPGEERNKEEKVTLPDLKGKKVDADPEKKRDQPLKDTS